jgi:hypothetical protein
VVSRLTDAHANARKAVPVPGWRAQLIFRVAIASAFIAALASLGTVSPSAQSASAKLKYPAEITAIGNHLAAKQESYRRQTKQ